MKIIVFSLIRQLLASFAYIATVLVKPIGARGKLVSKATAHSLKRLFRTNGSA